eukprot:5438056-Pyramimonas_sp.AAC.1
MSSQSVCIVAICRSGRHRSVDVSYGVTQFLKQYDIECSSARLSRHEWPRRVCTGECDDCCHVSDSGRAKANSAVDQMVSLLTEAFQCATASSSWAVCQA